MTDETTAIPGTRKSAKELVDGTLRVQIDIEPRDKARFHLLFPEIDMPVAIAPLALDGGNGGYPEIPADNPDTPQIDSKQIAKPYGQQAKELAQSSFFRTPAVWKAVGTVAEFQAWVQQQDCIVCGNQDFPPDTGIGRCEFAHVRRAGEAENQPEAAGTSYKPEYSGVPMCNAHHDLQHQHGETRAYRAHLVSKTGSEQQVTLDQAKDWFNKQRIQHLFKWCWETVKEELGYDSWARVPPRELHDWAEQHGIAQYLPPCYLIEDVDHGNEES